MWRDILNIDEPSVTSDQKNAIVEIEANTQELCAGFIVEDEYKFKDLNEVISRIQEGCPRYSFEHIYRSTGRFCHRPFDFNSDSGRRIGDGRFSSVFLAQTLIEQEIKQQQQQQQEERTVAAKLLKSECKLHYLVNEINLAMKIRHENILELLGISIGSHNGSPAFMCLVYPYMENGSLLECISDGLRCRNRKHIDWMKRIDMAIQIGRGISYLHTFKDGAIIHRDVKTANILVNYDLNPKLGDFTLVRQLDSLRTDETQYSQSIIGTSVYMPPEAFRGDISTKFDVFSFGIVLLELLSGKRPFDEELNEDLLTYVSENLSDIDDKITEQMSASYHSSDRITQSDDVPDLRNEFLKGFVDNRAGEWSKLSITRVLFDLAIRATEVRKRDRPEMIEIVRKLEMASSPENQTDLER